MRVEELIMFRHALSLPMEVWQCDSLPKLISGGIPVVPLNSVLANRRRDLKATPESLDTYTRAARLYSEFCAHLERSILDISNEEFTRFKKALQGVAFLNAQGESVRLSGKRQRGPHTADLMLSLIYTVAGDVEELYGVRFDWRRYRRVSNDVVDLMRALRLDKRSISFQREHSISWTPRKVIGLPDDQFVLLVLGARKRWGDTISDGDKKYATDPEAQRGALSFRNIAILFLLRYAGSRRREAVHLRMQDIDRQNAKLYLVTKGHGGESGDRLPVLLFPFVDEIIWHYVTQFRPEATSDAGDTQQRAFLSHSLSNYGRVITPQTVRKIIDVLRKDLDPPWNEILTPQMLRHSFGYDLQRMGGASATTANMRHASLASSDPYSAGIENFADELLETVGGDIEQILHKTGLLDLLGTLDE